MIKKDKYWIRISKKRSAKRKFLAGQWICFGDKTFLHGLQDELDKYVENEEITLILIALKDEGVDRFPNKPCVLCAFTSNNKLEKNRIRSILEDKFSLNVERWKSNWESIKDWDENGLLKIESELVQLKYNSNLSNQEVKDIALKIMTYINNSQNTEFQDYVKRENFLNDLDKYSIQTNKLSIRKISNIFDRICIYIWNSFEVNQDIKIDKKLDELKNTIASIKQNQEEQLLYIISKLPDKQFIQQYIGDINNETIQDIISWFTLAFQNQTIRNLENFIELESIFNELQKSSDWESKLKISVPLLNLIGIEMGVENKFNLGKYIANIKYEIEKIMV